MYLVLGGMRCGYRMEHLQLCDNLRKQIYDCETKRCTSEWSVGEEWEILGNMATSIGQKVVLCPVCVWVTRTEQWCVSVLVAPLAYPAWQLGQGYDATCLHYIAWFLFPHSGTPEVLFSTITLCNETTVACVWICDPTVDRLFFVHHLNYAISEMNGLPCQMNHLKHI